MADAAIEPLSSVSSSVEKIPDARVNANAFTVTESELEPPAPVQEIEYVLSPAVETVTVSEPEDVV